MMTNSKDFSDDDITDANLCMSKVMDFDVDDRYLMGFMGSGKHNSFLT